MKSNTYVASGKLLGQQTAYEQIDRLKPSDTSTGFLSMVIPHTTPELTRAALRHAEACSDLDVHVSLVDIQVVPFPCPLNEPPIDKEFSDRRVRKLLEETGLSGQATVFYTRDRPEAFRKVLDPRSLIILATKKRWWPTREERLARTLTKAGHQVMLLPVVR